MAVPGDTRLGPQAEGKGRILWQLTATLSPAYGDASSALGLGHAGLNSSAQDVGQCVSDRPVGGSCSCLCPS